MSIEPFAATPNEAAGVREKQLQVSPTVASGPRVALQRVIFRGDASKSQLCPLPFAIVTPPQDLPSPHRNPVAALPEGLKLARRPPRVDHVAARVTQDRKCHYAKRKPA